MNTSANIDLFDFEQFMRRREEAARAYVRGESVPLERIVTREFPATFFGPSGGSIRGAEAVAARYENDARAFGPGGVTVLDVIEMGVDGGLAYWVGFQRATARIDGQTIPMNLRITEIFRREDHDWKLVHRHADTLAGRTEDAQPLAPKGLKYQSTG